jgi:hypothetical protein
MHTFPCSGKTSQAMGPPRPVSRKACAAEWQSGDYLTDGARLFRVISKFAVGAEPALASLEDCLTLEIREYAPDELYAMRVRPLRTDE